MADEGGGEEEAPFGMERDAQGSLHFVYTTPDGCKISFPMSEYEEMTESGFDPAELAEMSSAIPDFIKAARQRSEQK